MRQATAEHDLNNYKENSRIQPILLSVGANLTSEFGDPEKTIKLAIARLPDENVEVAQVSRLYNTPAYPAGSGPDFVNAAIRATSELSPAEILAAIGRVEADFGRSRKTRWAPRTLDLDLIAVGDKILPNSKTHAFWRNIELSDQQAKVPDELVLPHPRLQDRAFVLVPLADVAKDWVHPILGKSVAQLLDSLPSAALREIKPI